MIRQMIAGMILGFGAIFLVSAFAYSRDLAAIAATPSIVWQFVCGVPIEDNTTIPLLVTLGVSGMGVGAGLLRFWAK